MVKKKRPILKKQIEAGEKGVRQEETNDTGETNGSLCKMTYPQKTRGNWQEGGTPAYPLPSPRFMFNVVAERYHNPDRQGLDW
jgi:hypothetical protein